MAKMDRVVVLAATLVGLSGCGGGGGSTYADMPAGASSPDAAVEVFLRAAQEAQAARQGGEFPTANRAYARMAAVFGTDRGSIAKAYPEQEVRDRMIVLAACLRPTLFRITSQPDFEAQRNRETLVTAEITRDRNEIISLPFRVVQANDDRWYVEQIHLSVDSFSC